MGVGRGYQPREFAMLGLADQQQHSRAIFAESLDVLIGLWENETFSYQGEYYQIDDVSLSPRPVQKPRPPIYVAAISPESFALVEKYGLNIMVTPTLMSLPELKENVIEAKKRLIKAGRDRRVAELPDELADAPRARPGSRPRSGRPKSLDWYFNLVMDLVPKGPNAPKGYEFMRDLAAAFEAGRRRVGAGAAGGRDHHPRRCRGTAAKHPRGPRRHRAAGGLLLDAHRRAVGREGPGLDEALRRGGDARVPGRGPGRPGGTRRLTATPADRSTAPPTGAIGTNAPGHPVLLRGGTPC